MGNRSPNGSKSAVNHFEGGKSLAGVVSRMSADEMAEAFVECRARLAVEAAKDHAEENARRAAGRHPSET